VRGEWVKWGGGPFRGGGGRGERMTGGGKVNGGSFH